jgi:hypothetical protein
MRNVGVLLLVSLLLASNAAAAQPASSAHDDSDDGGLVAVVRGEIGRAAFVELAPQASFVLIELTKLSEGTTPEDASRSGRGSRVPFVPDRCAHVWTMLSTRDPGFEKLAGDLVGKQVDGVSIPAHKPGTKAPKRDTFCRVVDGDAGLLGVPVVRPPDIARVGGPRGDAALKPLALARDFFGTPDDLAGYGNGSPLDSAIQNALEQNRSPHALIFALERRMYFFADFSHLHWRKNPENFALVENELYERPWLASDFRTQTEVKRVPIPDSSLISLFWMTSAKQAVASIRKLYERDPDKAMDILRWSMRRDDASDILVELTERDRARWLPSTLLMASRLGSEHALDFMRKERDAAGELQGVLDARIAELEKRRALGVTDGVSLARYAAAHRSDPMFLFSGMSLRVVGKHDLCCDIKAPLGGDVELLVDVNCDGDTYKRMCEHEGDGLVTVHGLVKSVSVTGNRVTLKLDDARVELGGELAPDLGPIVDAAPNAPERSGCSCAIERRPPVGSPWLMALALGLARRRRQLSAGQR